MGHFSTPITPVSGSFLHADLQKLILDFDATDDVVHGNQEDRFFHGYYDHYCFLPLYVFCRKQLLVSYLRPSKIDGAKHAWAILALLVKRLRQVWPQVRIIFRGDSGFCRWRMLLWCERNNVGYIVGIAKNKRLNALTAQRHRLPSAAFSMYEPALSPNPAEIPKSGYIRGDCLDN